MENEKINNENNLENKEIENQAQIRDMATQDINQVVSDFKANQIKRKRGRPRKTETEGISSSNEQFTATLYKTIWTEENAGLIAELPFQAAAMITGSEKWKLEPIEKETIAKPLTNVLNEYVPAGKYASLIALSSALVVVAGKKYLDYKKEKEQELKNEKSK